MLVGGMTAGISRAVVADRESYGMLKFIRISPARMGTYLIGRGLSCAAQAAIGAMLTLALGLVLFSELRAVMGFATIAWGWLLFYLAVGAVMVAGWVFVSLNMNRTLNAMAGTQAGLTFDAQLLTQSVLFVIVPLLTFLSLNFPELGDFFGTAATAAKSIKF